MDSLTDKELNAQSVISHLIPSWPYELEVTAVLQMRKLILEREGPQIAKVTEPGSGGGSPKARSASPGEGNDSEHRSGVGLNHSMYSCSLGTWPQPSDYCRTLLLSEFPLLISLALFFPFSPSGALSPYPGPQPPPTAISSLL